MRAPGVSAIIPTYNRANLVGRSISSVLSQLEDGDELIVVDDGSTDDTEKVVAKYGDRLRYVRTSNHGVGAARNRGVLEAKNPLVTFLDSDDEWFPGKTALQRSFMQAEPEVLFCFSNHCFRTDGGVDQHFALETWHDDRRDWGEILGPGKRISSLLSLPENISDFEYYVGNIYRSTLFYGNYLNINTLMVWRERARGELRFAEDVTIFEEWECLGRLARAGNCAYLDCETIRQNSHTGPRICSANRFERSCAKITIMERLWGDDRQFLVNHGEDYQCIHNQERFIRAEGLMIRGKAKESRQEFHQLAGMVPLSYRLLAALPGSIIKKLLSLRRTIFG